LKLRKEWDGGRGWAVDTSYVTRAEGSTATTEGEICPCPAVDGLAVLPTPPGGIACAAKLVRGDADSVGEMGWLAG